MSNQRVLKNAILERQKRIMTALVKKAAFNFGKQRFSKFLTTAETTSGQNADGSKGFAQVEGRFLGVQNQGATIPRRVPRRAAALRFTVGGRGTLVRNSLDSQRPIQGRTVVFTKSAKGFRLAAGRWDLANKNDVLENLDEIVKEA